MATQEYINIGDSPNDGSGDPLRTAFQKINNNFTALFATGYSTSNVYTYGNTPNQVIFEVPVNSFTHGNFQIRSARTDNPDSQDIILSVQVNNSETDLAFTAYGTTFIGNAICRYDMDVTSNNVRILANPIPNATMLHFISSQYSYLLPGYNLQLNNYATGTFLITEDELEIVTETTV